MLAEAGDVAEHGVGFSRGRFGDFGGGFGVGVGICGRIVCFVEKGFGVSPGGMRKVFVWEGVIGGALFLFDCKEDLFDCGDRRTGFAV